MAVFDFPRRNVFCTPSPGCSDSEPEVRALVAADARTEWAAETVDVRGKSAVLPDRTAVAFIHNAKPFPGQLVRKLNAESGHGFVHHFIFMLADSAARAKSNQDNVLNTSTVLAPVALDRVLVRDEPCSPTGA